MQQYNKAIIAGVVGVIFVFLNNMGITDQTTVGSALETIATVVAVYLVPNKKS